MPTLVDVAPLRLALDRLEPGPALHHGGLAVAPLLAPAAGEPDWLTLAEAGDAVTVTEVSEAGAVPFLTVVNAADRPLLLVHGEGLVGAKQNRVLNTTVLVYLVGHCHLNKDVRVFAVERIRAVRALGRTFEVPKAFDARAHLDRAWGILVGDLTQVRVVFSPRVARYVRERLWHPTQQFRALSDGRVEMTLRVADTLEVRRWILGYGADAEVVEPAGLREALRREAEALAAALAVPRRSLARVSGARTPPVRTGAGAGS